MYRYFALPQFNHADKARIIFLVDRYRHRAGNSNVGDKQVCQCAFVYFGQLEQVTQIRVDCHRAAMYQHLPRRRRVYVVKPDIRCAEGYRLVAHYADTNARHHIKQSVRRSSEPDNFHANFNFSIARI